MNMDNMIKLIPFLVEPLAIEVQIHGGWYTDEEMLLLNGKQYIEPLVIGKTWKVVGCQFRSGIECFLLIRDGEFTHWYPKQYCRVVEGEQ